MLWGSISWTLNCCCRFIYCEKCFNEVLEDDIELNDDPMQPAMYVWNFFTLCAFFASRDVTNLRWCALLCHHFYCQILKHWKSREKINIQCVPKKWRENRNHNDRQILSELNILLAALIITLQISTKSTSQFLSNSCLQNGTQKQKFPIWKSRLSSLYTTPSVKVCAQSGCHLHRHLHVSCADRTFSAAAGLLVCRPCIASICRRSRSSAEQDQSLSGNSSNNFLAL